jgi:hypothetical protein
VGHYLVPLAEALKAHGFSIEMLPPPTASIYGSTLLEMVEAADRALIGVDTPSRPRNARVMANTKGERAAD